MHYQIRRLEHKLSLAIKWQQSLKAKNFSNVYGRVATLRAVCRLELLQVVSAAGREATLRSRFCI